MEKNHGKAARDLIKLNWLTNFIYKMREAAYKNRQPLSVCSYNSNKSNLIRYIQ